MGNSDSCIEFIVLISLYIDRIKLKRNVHLNIYLKFSWCANTMICK